MLYLDKMVKIEDIVFWILMASIIAVAIWLLSGSPPLENGLLMLVIFVAGSEILLWKALFKIDKRTAIGFTKLKKDIEKIDSKLNNIETLIKKRK